MSKTRIGSRLVGPGEPVYVIAEAGSNHDGDLAKAKKLIDVASWAGADAVKFQSFTADGIVNTEGQKAGHMNDVDSEETVHEILRKYELPHSWHAELNRYARERNLTFLSTPFDFAAVQVLADIGIPAFKVASGDITHFPLLRTIARQNKPVILSTGCSTLGEVEAALDVILSEGNEQIVLLHCVGAYPTPYDQVNLQAMGTLGAAFGLPVGYSDHTLGTEVPLAACALGAVMVEKHFTLSRSSLGPDHFYALEPEELKSMIEGIRKVEKAVGDGKKTVRSVERECRQVGRRSIYARRLIPAGSLIEESQLKIVRPVGDLAPEDLRFVVGRVARVDIREGEPIKWENI